MIPEGKNHGWLRLDIDALQPWALLQGAQLSKIHFGTSADLPAKGAGVYADEDIEASADDFATTLLTVPRDLVLSRERVEQHSKVDSDLRAVLDSLGEFAKSSRIAILTFLVTQSTLGAPSVPEPHFVHSPFSSYIKFLPLESLPTFWSEEERALLTGTTLLPAVTAKLKSLYREFDQFRSLTSSISWTDRLWWDEVDGLLSFTDWLHVDAMYRSRALEFPGIGDCMAPCIDMANHASGDATSAIYEVDSNGDAVLLLRDSKSLAKNDEITITYGDAKGACEMLFSYGFLENTQDEAHTLFLDLHMMDGDPLAKPKAAVAMTAPGVKITGGESGLSWESDFIWMICINEEDGLEFMIQRTVDGSEELRAFFKEEELTSAADLKAKLALEPLWDVFQLRAVSILQDRIATQLTQLYGSDEEVEAAEYGKGTSIGTRIRELALQLRKLEGELLEMAYAYFEEQKEDLMKCDSVIAYLQAAHSEAPQPTTAQSEGVEEEEEDFS
ncbi:SET domain-containing protein [Myriangium duriaei CBS 260.36]|uniref:SET domain-containing protein n=1 Tax=Myriangium duriaei CBS 260.36 TaxID=1168546 RepID=A0A9P4MLY9_9PEZI|nr:SET domain-containing protein [Myriangium duriaei CBS 260.36]